MKLATKERFLYKSEELETNEFKLKASAKAFNILSSQIYTNKIRAIIRELSCNALDAHIAANKRHKKFDVWLPNNLNPTFKIRDYGTGISPEDIRTVYTTFFESTKTSSNEFIGALGLGSKSPFNYTDNFQVTSYYKGKKYSYAAFVNEAGIPECPLVSVVDTDEEDGLEVSFAVQAKDFPNFIAEAEFVFFWFKEEDRPNVYGQTLTIPNFETLVVGNDFEIDGKKITWKGINIPPWNTLNNSSSFDAFKGTNIVMGNVPYKLNVASFTHLKESHRKILNLDLYIEVPIGSVEIHPSRESLSLNKPTTIFLNKIFDEIEKYIIKILENELLDNCATYWDACIYYTEKLGSNQNFINFSHAFLKYKGRPIQTALSHPSRYYSEFYLYRRFVDYSGNIFANKSHISKVVPSKSLAFVLCPANFSSEPYVLRKISTWCRFNDKGFTQVVLLPDDAFIKAYEVSEKYVFSYDSLPKPVVNKTATKSSSGKKKNQVYLATCDVSNIDFCHLKEVDFDTIEDSVYILVKHKKPYIRGEIPIWSLESVVHNFNCLNIDKKIDRIYGLTESQIKIVEKLPNWKHVYTYIEEALNEVVNNDPLFSEFIKNSELASIEDMSILSQVERSNDYFRYILQNLPKDHPISKLVLERRQKYYFNLDKELIKINNYIASNAHVIAFGPELLKNYTEMVNSAKNFAIKEGEAFLKKEVSVIEKYPVILALCMHLIVSMPGADSAYEIGKKIAATI